MNDKQIHVTVRDEETRNAVTTRFDTWGEVIKFAEKAEKVANKKTKEKPEK